MASESEEPEPANSQTWDLKVSLHCEGCERKVEKILHKVHGVHSVDTDPKQNRVKVTGKVDGESLIQKLLKYGKHAEIVPEVKKAKAVSFAAADSRETEATRGETEATRGETEATRRETEAKEVGIPEGIYTGVNYNRGYASTSEAHFVAAPVEAEYSPEYYYSSESYYGAMERAAPSDGSYDLFNDENPNACKLM